MAAFRRTGVTRRRLSYANVVATLALVVALAGGTAYAANHYLITSKSQIKPSVLSQLKGNAGPKGAAGDNGATGPAGATGASGAEGLGVAALFGDGIDASPTLSQNTTLTRDMYYENLTIDPGITLDTNGFRVFVAGTLTLGNGASIEDNGAASTGAGPGAGASAGTLGAGVSGGYSGVTPNTEQNSLGGAGGCAESISNPLTCGYPGGQVAAPLLDEGGSNVFRSAVQAITGYTPGSAGALVTGGGGGSGSCSAGGCTVGYGGGGGGVVVVAAANVVLTSGSATISANGGNALPDGGGGGGGVVVVVTTSAQPAGLTLSAAGGTDSGYATADGHAGFTDWES
jgi:hypothetical protein